MDRSELALPKMSIHLKISEGFYHVFSRSAERTDGGRTCHPWSQDGGRTRTAACGGPQKPTPYPPWNCHRTADRLTPPPSVLNFPGPPGRRKISCLSRIRPSSASLGFGATGATGATEDPGPELFGHTFGPANQLPDTGRKDSGDFLDILPCLRNGNEHRQLPRFPNMRLAPSCMSACVA